MMKSIKFVWGIAIFTLSFCLIISNSTVVGAEGISLSIPDGYGRIKEAYTDSHSDLVLVHIQDLHCNYDAQMSIQNIVNKLVNEDDFNLVAMEGSIGNLDTKPFCNYSDEEIKEKVAHFFLKEGSINGPGYAHIMNKGSFAFWGADDPQLYETNKEAFMASLNLRNDYNVFCENIKSILKQFRQKVYNKELAQFDKQLQAYKAGELSFGKFAFYLNEIISEKKLEKNNYNNFNTLIRVLTLEKDIDFTLVDTQRSNCIDKLSKKLKGKKLSKLLDMSLHFKTAKISAVEFYSYLRETVGKSKRISFDKYPELDRYISYILSYNEIGHMQLFNEIDMVQGEVKEKLFRRPIEKEIDALSKNIEILQSLANLKLTTKTLESYRKDRSAFLASNFTNFITKNARQYRIKYNLGVAFRKIDVQLPDLEKFYTAALERDKALVNNTIDRMNRINAKKGVLVAGGFHTDGIKEALKKKGISYIIITPKVDELDGTSNLYQEVMLGKKTMFENLFYEEFKGKEYAEVIAFQKAAKYYADIVFKTILNKGVAK